MVRSFSFVAIAAWSMSVFLVFSSRFADAKGVNGVSITCNADAFVERVTNARSDAKSAKTKADASRVKVTLDTVQSSLVQEQSAFLHRKDSLVLKMDATIGLNTGYILALSNRPKDALRKARNALAAFKSHVQIATRKLAEGESRLRAAEENFKSKPSSGALKRKSEQQAVVKNLDAKVESSRGRVKEAEIAVSVIEAKCSSTTEECKRALLVGSNVSGVAQLEANNQGLKTVKAQTETDSDRCVKKINHFVHLLDESRITLIQMLDVTY
jgi:hypothetical protein